MTKWGERWTPERVTEHQRRMALSRDAEKELVKSLAKGFDAMPADQQALAVERAKNAAVQLQREPLQDRVVQAPPVVAKRSRQDDKFRNRPTGKYRSKRESLHAQKLRLMQQAGEISELKEQVKYVLIPRQDDEQGKCIERQATYTADFTFIQGGRLVVQDVKGFPNDRWALKRKLMLLVHKIRVVEV